MRQSTYQYRGYRVGLQQKHSHILVCVSPETSDLPILPRCMFEIAAQSEIEAIAEAKRRGSRAIPLTPV
jgi:hypothetical protein